MPSFAQKCLQPEPSLQLVRARSTAVSTLQWLCTGRDRVSYALASVANGVALHAFCFMDSPQLK